MKKKSVLIIITLVAICLVSCEIRFDQYEKDKDFAKQFVLCPTKSDNTISIEEEASWYACDEDGKIVGDVLNTGKTFEIPDFDDPEVRYYKCIVGESEYMYYVSYTGLPTIYIDTKSGKDITSRSTYVEGSIRVLSKKGKEQINEDITVRGRGNSSWSDCKKKGYNFKFESKTEVLDLTKAKKWCLIANGRDAGKLSNWYSGYLREEVMQSEEWNANYEYANLILNGVYEGIYTVAESIKIDKKRINVPDIAEITKESEDVNQDGKVDLYDGGFVLEIGYTRDSAVEFATPHGANVMLSDPDLEEGTELYTFNETAYHIRKLVNETEQAIYDSSSQKYQDLFDVPSFIDWYIVSELLGSGEASFQTSVYMYYKPEDGKFHMSSTWDFDQVQLNGTSPRTNTATSLWVRELLSKPEVAKAVLQRWNEVKSDVEKSIKDLGKKADDINTAVVFDALRWQTEYRDKDTVKKGFTERLNWFDGYLNELCK